MQLVIPKSGAIAGVVLCMVLIEGSESSSSHNVTLNNTCK